MSVRPSVLRRKFIGAASAAFLSIAVAHADELVLDIPAQDMGSSITQLARQAKLQILFSANLVEGRKTQGLKGSYTPEAALRTLLAGSGIAFRANGDGTYALRPAPLPRKPESAADHSLSEIVVAATRTANPKEKVAASVSVVTQEDFEDAQAATVSQVMKKLPNVDFGGGPRVNGEIPTIRGVSGASVSLLVDGARQNDTTSPGLKSPLLLDPYFLRQAEVLRGSASSLYGSGGNGGVMAFTTYSARDLLASGQSVGGGAKVAYGDADRSTRVNARLYGGNDVADGLIAMGSHDWNKIRQGGGSYLDPNDGKASTGLIKLGIQPVPDTRIEFSHQFYKSDNLQVNNSQATDYKTANFPLDKPAVQMVHVDQANTILKGALGNADGAPAIAATLYKTTLKYEYDRSPDPAITNVLYSNTKTDTDGASLQGTHIIDGAGWGRHRLTAGIDWFKDRQSSIAATAANPAAPSSVIRDGIREVTGVFVQDEIALGGGWNLAPSLRSDYYEASLKDGGLPGNSASRVSPKLVLSWLDGDGLMVYGNYGEAFRAPTVGDLYQNFTGFGLTNFLPNAGLKPEIDRALEVGASYKRKAIFSDGDAMKWRVALFDSRVTDLIYNTNLGGMTPTGSTPVQQATYAANCAATGLNCKFQWQNVPDAKRTGGEVEGGYTLDKWQFNAAYSRVRVENRGNGDKLFSPPDKLALQIRRQLPAQSMTVFWNTTGIAAQDYDSTVLRRRPGYATHDLFGSWMPAGQKFKLDVGITNLFDKRYSAYQSSNAYAYTYQEGRSLKLTVSTEF